MWLPDLVKQLIVVVVAISPDRISLIRSDKLVVIPVVASSNRSTHEAQWEKKEIEKKEKDLPRLVVVAPVVVIAATR